MNYATAKRYADQVVEWLGPFCERIKIAGSIRRERPECRDLDMVAIPRVIETTDLLGDSIGGRNLLKEELERYVRENEWRGAKWGVGEEGRAVRGAVGTEATTNFLLRLVKCELNVFCAKGPENFGAVLLTYTGSKEHNIWLAARAKTRGLEWSATKGVLTGDGRRLGREEIEIYNALGLAWMPPACREAPFHG